MSLIEGGDIDLDKERKPREISKEQGDLAAHWTEESKEKIQGAANIFGFEGHTVSCQELRPSAAGAQIGPQTVWK